MPNIIGLIKALAHPAARSRIGDKGNGRYKGSKLVNSSSPSAGAPSHPLHNDDREGFERLVNSERSVIWNTTMNGQSCERSMDGSRTAIPLDSIHVQTQISIVDRRPPASTVSCSMSWIKYKQRTNVIYHGAIFSGVECFVSARTVYLIILLIYPLSYVFCSGVRTRIYHQPSSFIIIQRADGRSLKPALLLYPIV